MGDFFTSESDAALAQSIVSRSADIYIAELFAASSGVMDKSYAPTTTITPAVSPAWTPDALIGDLVVLQDDNGKAREFVIADNDADSFTVDLTSDVDGNDHSADFTDTDTFQFRIWDAEEFLGYTKGEDEFTDEPETKKFKRGLPRAQVREDVVERIPTLKTVITTPSPGVLKAIGNLKDDNTNATYYVLEAGSNPSARPYYYVILKNTNVNNKAQQLRCYYCQIKADGARKIGGTDTDYEQLGVIITLNADPLRGNDVDDNNLFRVRIEK